MRVPPQTVEELLSALSPLDANWMDETAKRVIGTLRDFPTKEAYAADDIRRLLDNDFDDGLLIVRLFLGRSKDEFTSIFKQVRDGAGFGVKAYRADPDSFIRDLMATGVGEAMAEQVGRPPHWSDVLVERLRSGRGSAISGQARGRGLEDFAESILRSVFGQSFEARCTFQGARGSEAKCDFAVPSRKDAYILVESKGYAATGSKMTDILGDLRSIARAKRSDTALLFVTDGLTWDRRRSDLAKIVEMQNAGEIMRIYTTAMTDQFQGDLRRLKAELGL